MSPIGPTRRDTNKVEAWVFRKGSQTIPMYHSIMDKMTGGEVNSESQKYRPGNMEDPISLGGTRNATNVVVSRIYRLGNEHVAIDALMDGVGKCWMKISRIPLDLDGNAGSTPATVYNGRLIRCTPPEVDSESSEAGLLELEMEVEGFPHT